MLAVSAMLRSMNAEKMNEKGICSSISAQSLVVPKPRMSQNWPTISSMLIMNVAEPRVRGVLSDRT